MSRCKPAKILLPLLLLVAPLAQANIGKVIYAAGPVTVERGETLELKKGDLLLEGDIVVTGERARVQLFMMDGARLSIRANSRVGLDIYRLDGAGATSVATTGAEGQVSLRLIKGGFRTVTGAIGKIDRSDFSLSTPVATLGIRGTDFNTTHCDGDCAPPEPGAPIPADGTYAGVNMGGVVLSNSAGSVDLDRNQYGYVRNASTPPQQLLTPPGVFNRELAGSPDEDSDDDGDGDGDKKEGRTNSEGKGGGSENAAGGEEGPAGERESAPPADPDNASQGNSDNGNGQGSEPEQTIVARNENSGQEIRLDQGRPTDPDSGEPLGPTDDAGNAGGDNGGGNSGGGNSGGGNSGGGNSGGGNSGGGNSGDGNSGGGNSGGGNSGGGNSGGDNSGGGNSGGGNSGGGNSGGDNSGGGNSGGDNSGGGNSGGDNSGGSGGGDSGGGGSGGSGSGGSGGSGSGGSGSGGSGSGGSGGGMSGGSGDGMSGGSGDTGGGGSGGSGSGGSGGSGSGGSGGSGSGGSGGSGSGGSGGSGSGGSGSGGSGSGGDFRDPYQPDDNDNQFNGIGGNKNDFKDGVLDNDQTDNGIGSAYNAAVSLEDYGTAQAPAEVFGSLVPEGSDADTELEWGRWDSGFLNAPADAHYVTDTQVDRAVVLPTTGTLDYTLSDGTAPTDSNGNTGTLNSGSLSADFVNMKVTNEINLTIDSETWNAVGEGQIDTGAPVFNGSYDVTRGASQTPNGTGNFSGFFGGAPLPSGAPSGAGVGYSLEAGGVTVNGAAAFKANN